MNTHESWLVCLCSSTWPRDSRQGVTWGRELGKSGLTPQHARTQHRMIHTSMTHGCSCCCSWQQQSAAGSSNSSSSSIIIMLDGHILPRCWIKKNSMQCARCRCWQEIWQFSKFKIYKQALWWTTLAKVNVRHVVMATAKFFSFEASQYLHYKEVHTAIWSILRTWPSALKFWGGQIKQRAL